MSDHNGENPITVPAESHPGIVQNPDGTYTRFLQFPFIPATPDPDPHSPILTKDVPLNLKNQTWFRIFLPRQPLHTSSSTTKLPLIVYFHGGGFVYISASTADEHNFCADLAGQVGAVVVSVEYRLAPEHRLPAAYDDAVEALHCIKTTEDTWLTEFADFSNCFLMGTSAGGNIAYHAGLRVAAEIDDLEPLKIKGLILYNPFFGGLERTGSDLRLANAPVLTLSGSDYLWELSLPIDGDRDHEYCNPIVGGGSDQLDRIRLLGWRILVTGCFGDLLIDRQIELAKMLEKKGVRTVAHFDEGYHAMEVIELSKAKDLFVFLKSFTYLSAAYGN